MNYIRNYIIHSFLFQETNTLMDIYNYIKYRHQTFEIIDVKKELTQLIKHNILFFNKTYHLTKEGHVILKDHIYYYSKIILNFYRKYNKKCVKYSLLEIRQEQQQLRKYLISNKPHMCIICEKKVPLCLLETAHLKPRGLFNDKDKHNKSIVEFMCRYCHTLYDNGVLSVYKGLLQVSDCIHLYDLHYIKNKQISQYNIENEPYFMFHYNYIYKGTV